VNEEALAYWRAVAPKTTNKEGKVVKERYTAEELTIAQRKVFFFSKNKTRIRH